MPVRTPDRMPTRTPTRTPFAPAASSAPARRRGRSVSAPLGALALLCALGAGPVAQAAAIVTTPDAPQFSCAGSGDAGGTVSWPNGISVIGPTLGYLDETLAEVEDLGSKLDCDDGAFAEGVSERKTKDRKKIEYLKVTMKDVLVSSYRPAPPPQDPAGSPVRWSVSSVLRDAGADAGQWVTQWDLLTDYVQLNPQTGALLGRSTHFLGLRHVGAAAFEGLDQVRIGYDTVGTTLSFIAPLQATAGRFSLQDAPLAVPEPGGLALAGLGLAALGVVRRRRRG